MERETSKTITIPIEWAKAMYEAHTGKTVDEDFVKTYKETIEKERKEKEKVEQEKEKVEQKVQEALKLLEKERQAKEKERQAKEKERQEKEKERQEKEKERQEKEIGIVNMYNLGKMPIALISKILNKEEAFIKEILKKYRAI